MSARLLVCPMLRQMLLLGLGLGLGLGLQLVLGLGLGLRLRLRQLRVCGQTWRLLRIRQVALIAAGCEMSMNTNRNQLNG